MSGYTLSEAIERIGRLEGVIKKRDATIIELRAALQAVIRYAGNAGDDCLADFARAALEGPQDRMAKPLEGRT